MDERRWCSREIYKEDTEYHYNDIKGAPAGDTIQ